MIPFTINHKAIHYILPLIFHKPSNFEEEKNSMIGDHNLQSDFKFCSRVKIRIRVATVQLEVQSEHFNDRLPLPFDPWLSLQ